MARSKGKNDSENLNSEDRKQRWNDIRAKTWDSSKRDGPREKED